MNFLLILIQKFFYYLYLAKGFKPNIIILILIYIISLFNNLTSI